MVLAPVLLPSFRRSGDTGAQDAEFPCKLHRSGTQALSKQRNQSLKTQAPGSLEPRQAAAVPQRWASRSPPAARLERRKRADLSSRLCGHPKLTICKAFASRGVGLKKNSLGVQRVVGMLFPGDYFRSGERGALRGTGLSLGQRGAGGSPWPRWTAQEAPGPPRERRRIVSFQSENLQALGNDIQKSI